MNSKKKSNSKTIMSIIAVILVMITIFCLSNQSISNSLSLSHPIAETLNIQPSYKNQEISNAPFLFGISIRNTAHIALFALLSLAVWCLTKNFALTAIFCYLFAVLDEIHQYFVPGRSSKFSDTLFDLAGIVLALVVVSIVKLIIIKFGKDKREIPIKICFVGSSGGHLAHLYMLKPFWENKERIWVTFDKEDARSILVGEKLYPCYFPSNRSFKALVINTFVAIKVLFKENPNVIISTGAAPAIPFFYLGKLLGMKTIYIEVFDRINTSTMAGRMCYPVSDVFIVEWEEMKQVYPKAINLGSLF